MGTPYDAEIERARVRASGGQTDRFTDMANAELLVERYGDRFRYVPNWRKFLAYTGTHWQVDEAGVMRFAMQSARGSLELAKSAYFRTADNCASDDGAKPNATLGRANAQVRWAVKSQQAKGIQAAIALAKHHEKVAVDHTALDADPYLLNVVNGTVDLRTGELRPHDPRDMITKIAPVTYDPRATAPQWEAFVRWAMHEDDALVSYLRRIVGYAAVGVIREHVLGFMFGGGKNGKSTFLGRVQHVLGDYAQPAPRGLLFTSRSPQHPTELASLYGARFVTCSEIEEGRAFDEAKVKDLTGGDLISARRMKEDFWKFAPTHTLFIAGNHKPDVRGTDDGIWRRMRIVPWAAQVDAESMDPELPAKLDAEAPGILAWVVRGALEWQRDGLGDPIAVTAATAAYREESDPLAEFLTLNCVFEDGAKVARKMLRGLYQDFCEDNGTKPIDAKAFAKRLRERGVEDGDVRLLGKVVNGWKGVRLRDLETEPASVGTSVLGGTDCTLGLGELSRVRPHYAVLPTGTDYRQGGTA